MNPAGPREPQTITRRQAARLLRAARDAFHQQTDSAGERIGWVYSAMRERPAARRLKIDYLLAMENHDAADALLAKCLLQEQEQPLIRLRYARSMFAQGRLRQADREVRRVLVLRPQHGAALVLASQIAGALGQRRRAVALLVLACDERPNNDRLRCLLIQALLDAGMVERAATVLADRVSPPLISARVLRAQARIRDAIDLLHGAVKNDFGADRDAMLRELIDLLEHVGDRAQLATLMQDIDDSEPATLLRGTQAIMALGSCDGAVALMNDRAVDPGLKQEWFQTAMVAHAARGDRVQARAALDSLRRFSEGKSNSRLAEMWLRGLIARTISEQTDARQASADPHLTLLQPMVQQAIDTFDTALASSAETPAGADRELLKRHRAIGLHALGRPVEAAASLIRSTRLSDHEPQRPGDLAQRHDSQLVRKAA